MGVLPADGLDALVGGLGRGGADTVLLCQSPTLAGPPLDATHGAAIAAAAERIPPALFLFPAGDVGPELGPRLAARLGAAYAPAADIRLAPSARDGGGGPSRRLTLRRWRAARDAYRTLDPAELERPVIVTLAARPAPEESGSDDVEIQMIACPEPSGPAITELEAEPDEDADLELAWGLVLVSREADVPAVRNSVQAVGLDGVAVRSLDQTTPAPAMPALQRACPGFVITVDAGRATTPAAGTTPATRVGAVTAAAAPPTPDEIAALTGVDVIWSTGDGGLAAVAAILPELDPTRAAANKTSGST